MSQHNKVISARQPIRNVSTTSSNNEHRRYQLEIPTNYPEQLSMHDMSVPLLNNKPSINNLDRPAMNFPSSSRHQHSNEFHPARGEKQHKYVLQSAYDTSIGTTNTLLPKESSPVLDLNAAKQGKTTKLPRWWVTLPVLLIITIISTTDGLFMNDLIVTRYENYYHLNSSKSSQRSACLNSGKTTTPPMQMYFNNYYNPIQQKPTADYNMVQKAAAKLNMIISASATAPSLISFIILGANCDIIGRKPLVIIPFIGKALRYALILIIVEKNLADAWIVIAHVIEGLFGTSGLITLSSFAYVTDCTTIKNRTKAYIITDVILLVARIVPLISIGFWLKYHGYTTPASINVALSFLGLLYAITLHPESNQNVKHLSFFQQLKLIRLKPIIRVIKVFVIKRPSNNRKIIILLTLCHLLLAVMLFGSSSIHNLYLYGKPFCFDSLAVSLLTLAQTITTVVLAFTTLRLIKQRVDNYVFPVIGALAYMIYLVIFGLARTIWLLYIAACIGSLSFVINPVLRSKITMLIEQNEYAVVFIASAVIESVGGHVVSIVTNAIYNATLYANPGLIFIILAITGVLPIALLAYLLFMERRTYTNSALPSEMKR